MGEEIDEEEQDFAAAVERWVCGLMEKFSRDKQKVKEEIGRNPIESMREEGLWCLNYF